MTRRFTPLMMLCILGMASIAFAQHESALSRKVGELSDKLAFASEGKILSVRKNTVYVDLGQKDGVVQGNRFEVVRLGEPLMVGDKIIGHEETIIGEIEALRVRKDFLIATITRRDNEIHKGDKVYQLKRKIRRVAVTEFPYGNHLNDFTRNLQDLLYTYLIQKGMSVVEREKLEQVLREQKIAYSGIIDLETAAKVGKILGVEGILVGSVADLGNIIAITARLVDVEKGSSITAARVELSKTSDIIGLLGKGRRTIAKQQGAPLSEQPASPVAATPVQVEGGGGVPPASMGDIAVQVKSLRARGKELLLALTYTNKGKQPMSMTFGHPQKQKLYIIDNSGNEYKYVKSTGGMDNRGLDPSRYSPRDLQYMLLPVGRKVDVLYTFASSSEGKDKGSLFSLFIEHYLLPKGAKNNKGQTRTITFTEIRPQ